MDSALPKTPVLTVHVGTYCRSIRRPQPACQSSHSDSTPGAQSAQTGLSLGAAACGASRRLHSCSRQRSAEKRGPVRSVIRGASPSHARAPGEAVQTHTCYSTKPAQGHSQFRRYFKGNQTWLKTLHYMLLYVFGNTVHYSFIPPPLGFINKSILASHTM